MAYYPRVRGYFGITDVGWYEHLSRTSDGLALRTDLHRLFDRGYVSIDENDRFVVGRRLKDDFANGRSYYDLHGKTLGTPSDLACRPSAEALRWHREQVFLG
jgi:putative restriction endonuclease